VQKRQTAAFYLRMQFADQRGWPPQMYCSGTITAMQTGWQRRHGPNTQFSTKLGGVLSDAACLMIGRMCVHCAHLPSFGEAECYAFLAVSNLFGAHSVATLPKEQAGSTSLSSTIDAGTYTRVWISMRRVLSMPEHTKIYHTDAPGRSESGGQAYSMVRQCRLVNDYVGLNAAEFAVRKEGKRQVLLQEANHVATKDHKRKKKGSNSSTAQPWR
jgi:hypothetical protein